MNTIIKAENIVVDFPLYGTRSFKNKLITGITGGKIKMSQRNNVVRALDNLSFEFNNGDRVGLLGHNGSGKTTLLRTLAKIYRPNEGKININGTIASLLNIHVGTEAEATGIENIYLRAAVMGYSKKMIQPHMEDIIEFTELGDFIYLPMRTYSSGMQIRLRFAVSTAIHADIVLMDEWLSVGDESFMKKASERLNKMVERSKLLVIASHNKDLVYSLCNRVFHMENGKIVKDERIG